MRNIKRPELDLRVPGGEPEVGIDADELGDAGMSIASGGVTYDGGLATPSLSGTMRRRPGIDDEEPDTEPMGWQMPEWDD